MSVLKILKLAALVKPAAAPANPTERGRAKLRSYLADQRALLTATLEGKPFAAVRTVNRKDEAGNRVRAEVPKIVRQGWFAGDGGKTYFQLRYGAKPLELAKGMTAVEIEKLDALPGVIDTLDQAVVAGEFDTIVAAAAKERGDAFKARGKKG